MRHIRTECGDAAMSFVDIARELGYSDPEGKGRKTVFMAYQRAIQKLRHLHPQALNKLMLMAEAARRQRELRQDGRA